MKKQYDWTELNREGLIPGPTETEDEFYVRAEYCLNLKDSLETQLALPGKLDTQSSQRLIQKAALKTRPLFDIIPDWAPIVFSDQKLAPWHGGCAWIFQLTVDSPTAAFFQLRSTFATRERFLWIYDRAEIIAHEAAHVGRMMFEEPKFEELLAYRTSSNAFRCYFGPIIQSAWESIVFVLLLFLSLISELLFFGSTSGVLVGIKALPWLFLGIGLGRLWVRQRQFSNCLKRLRELLQDNEKANAVVYRLQDEEIIRFGKMSADEIRAYARAQTSLRWKIINNSYFPNGSPQR